MPEQRVPGRRTWIKLYPIDCLYGSIRFQLEPAERGVWYDLLLWAGICNQPGLISDKDARAYPRSFVANRLNVPLALLETTLDKCIEEGRIKENGTGIKIVNWHAYQSEYQRQKPYRQKQGLPETSDVICPDCGWQGISNSTADSGTCPDCWDNKKHKVKLQKKSPPLPPS